MTRKKIGIVLIMFMIIFILAGCGSSKKDSESKKSSNSYETPVEHFVNGIQNGDYKEFKKAYPSFVTLIMTEDELADVAEEYADMYGDDYKITYEISEKEKLDESDLEDMQEKIEDIYDKEVEITDGYGLSVDLEVKGSEGKDTDTIDMNVYKIDDSWYYLGN